MVNNESYGLPSDLYSVGVVLLELQRGRTLEALKDKGAAKIVKDAVDNLPNQPFPNLIRALLEVDPEKRWTAKRALESEVFRKYGLFVKGGDKERETFRVVNVSEALPLEDSASGEQIQMDCSNGTKFSSVAKARKRNQTKIDPVLLKRYHKIQKIAHELESDHPLTTQAALSYSIQMCQLDESIDDLKESQALVDCVILAYKVFEREMWCFRALEKKMDRGILKDCNWTVQDYRDNEGSIWLLMDFCLYPRKLLEL